MSNPVIEAEGLCRTYRRRQGRFRSAVREIEAVRDVSLEIQAGELFGLLGPNGAGKTTTIKMLNTLLIPTSGRARVCGLDVEHNTVAVRRRIGYVFGGDRGLYDRLSAYDNLRYFAELYRLDLRNQRRRINEVLEIVGLLGREHERVETFSRGMRQRLHIARGLLHQPDVLFLDEPSLGLDPVAARDLRNTVSDLTATGTTVLLTTHYMAEADELCDRIAIISGGRLLAEGTPRQLKRTAATTRVLHVGGADLTEEHAARVRSLPTVTEVLLEEEGAGHALRIHTDTDTDVRDDVLDLLREVRIQSIVDREPSLEDAYVAITAGSESS